MIYALAGNAPQFAGDYYVADSAAVIGAVKFESNASVWFNCVVRGDNGLITLGENCNVQDGAVLHTDPGIELVLGKNVSVGHMAMLHGCTVGANTLIGIKAVVLNGAVIGKNCLIGANALIAEGKTIPDGSVVLGSPGKITRQIKDDEMRMIKGIADAYVARFKHYRRALKPLGN